MNICVLGAGYVGLVTGVGLAELGHSVTCVDIDSAKIDKLERGEIPFYEQGLAALVDRNRQAGRLAFAVDALPALGDAEIAMIAVGTPGGPDGRADLRAVRAAARTIAAATGKRKTVIVKSTVPVGTGDEIAAILDEANPGARFDVVSNPEFLREGSAVGDFMAPDRIVFGRADPGIDPELGRLYAGLDPEPPVVVTDRRSAELIKYASNSFLAMKVTFINEMADIAEQVGADVGAISEGIGLDPRIGPGFLRAGPGYGGSCFPKDMLALIRTARNVERPSRLVEATVDVNNHRISGMAGRVVSALGGSAAGRTVALLGLTFKPDTDDVRASAAITIAQTLIAEDTSVRVYDPEGMDNARPLLDGAVFAGDALEAARGADALVIVTEWAEFRALDPERVKRVMAGRAVLDFRNILNAEAVAAAGLDYYPVGRTPRLDIQATRDQVEPVEG